MNTNFLFHSSDEALSIVYAQLAPSLLLKKIRTLDRKNYLLAILVLFQQSGEEASECQEYLLKTLASFPDNSLKKLKKIKHPMVSLVVEAIKRNIEKSFGKHKLYGLMFLAQFHDENFNLPDDLINQLIVKTDGFEKLSALEGLTLLTPVLTEKQDNQIQDPLQGFLNEKEIENCKAVVDLLHARVLKVRTEKEGEEILSSLFRVHKNSFYEQSVGRSVMKAIKTLASRLSREKRLSLITPDKSYYHDCWYWSEMYAAIMPALSQEDRQDALATVERKHWQFSEITLIIIKKLADTLTKDERQQMISLVDKIIDEAKQYKITAWDAYKIKATLLIDWEEKDINNVYCWLKKDLKGEINRSETSKRKDINNVYCWLKKDLKGGINRSETAKRVEFFLPLLRKSKNMEIFELVINWLQHENGDNRCNAWKILPGFLPYLSSKDCHKVFSFSLLAFYDSDDQVRGMMLQCLHHFIPRFTSVQRQAIFILTFETLKFKNTAWARNIRNPALAILSALAPYLSSDEKQKLLTEARNVFEHKEELFQKTDALYEATERELEEIIEAYQGDDPLNRQSAVDQLSGYTSNWPVIARNKILTAIAISLNKNAINPNSYRDSLKILTNLAASLNESAGDTTAREKIFYWRNCKVVLNNLEAVVSDLSIEERRQVLLIIAQALKENDSRILQAAMKVIKTLSSRARKEEHQGILALVLPLIEKDSSWEGKVPTLALQSLEFLMSSLTQKDFNIIKINLKSPSLNVRKAALQLLTRLNLSSATYLHSSSENTVFDTVEEILFEVMIRLEKKVHYLLNQSEEPPVNRRNAS